MKRRVFVFLISFFLIVIAFFLFDFFFFSKRKGDFITISSSLAVDTTYHLEILIQYSSTVYNFIISNNGDGTTPWYMQPFVWILSGFGLVFGYLKLAGPQNFVNTQQAKIKSRNITKQGFKPRRR